MIKIIGTKVGMTQVFDDKGILTPVTVIKVDDNVVVGKRTEKENGYDSVVVGAIDMKEKHGTKPYLGQFKDGIAPKRVLKEIKDLEKEVSVGDVITIEDLKDLEFVDIQGISKGKGYQGVMKRHGFGGGRKTHGSKFHRGLGSTGMAAWPSKVLKGTKMPGRMGSEAVTVLNLEIIKVDVEKKALLIKGAVPGRKNGTVIIRKAVKKY